MLFHGDQEAYKAALNEFIVERGSQGDGEELVTQEKDPQEAAA